MININEALKKYYPATTGEAEEYSIKIKQNINKLNIKNPRIIEQIITCESPRDLVNLTTRFITENAKNFNKTEADIELITCLLKTIKDIYCHNRFLCDFKFYSISDEDRNTIKRAVSSTGNSHLLDLELDDTKTLSTDKISEYLQIIIDSIKEKGLESNEISSGLMPLNLLSKFLYMKVMYNEDQVLTKTELDLLHQFINFKCSILYFISGYINIINMQ